MQNRYKSFKLSDKLCLLIFPSKVHMTVFSSATCCRFGHKDYIVLETLWFWLKKRTNWLKFGVDLRCITLSVSRKHDVTPPHSDWTWRNFSSCAPTVQTYAREFCKSLDYIEFQHFFTSNVNVLLLFTISVHCR